MKFKNPKTGTIFDVSEEHGNNVLIPQRFFERIEDELPAREKRERPSSPERDQASQLESKQVRGKPRKNISRTSKV